MKKDATDKLYAAVASYIKSRGGSAVVIGGISIIRWPGEQKYNFTLGVGITGKIPTVEIISDKKRALRRS